MDEQVNITIKLSRSVVEKLEKKAREAGLNLEEYLLELTINDLDPLERIQEYVEASKNLLKQAKEELAKGNVRQAAEKLWGATALIVKAYAEWREGKRLASHGELWSYSRKLIEDLGEWVYDVWMAANGMHTCFYEGWCIDKHVEKALDRIEKLVGEVERRISKRA